METIRAVLNAFKLPDLRRKIFVTLGILVVYRLAAHIPLPGVDADALRTVFRQSQLLGLFDMLSGGAMSTFSVVAMGVYPYITATIIMQLVMPMIPRLQEIAQEGEAGRQKINQYTHLVTVPLAALNAVGQAAFLTRTSPPVLSNWGFSGEALLPTLATISALTAGTMFAMWLGELIDEQGVGNGISLIIFGGIVARIPQQVGRDLRTNVPGLIAFAVIGVITVAGIVVIYEGQRRIPVQYGKRVRGTKIYGGQSTHVPLRVNSAGMIPIIFAMSIMLLPGTIASYFANPVGQDPNFANHIMTYLGTGYWLYWLLYFLLVVLFTFFYTIVVFQQQNLAETLQRQGGFVPGIRPGKPTGKYLSGVLNRITWGGAIFLGMVAIMPFIAKLITNDPTMQVVISSTALLIIVGVVLDTMRQMEAQLVMRRYEGFIK